MINAQRLAQTFMDLVRIDSVSKEEADVAAELKQTLEAMGGAGVTDRAGEATGSNSGNLIVKFEGTVDRPPLMLNAHMDTVEPGRGIKPTFKEGVFTSDGSTILGSDDKSAVAIIIETMRVLRENRLPHGPLELVFTVCEEIGLLGAKHLDFDLISAKMGYALDASDTDGIVTRAPAANRLDFKVHGKDAHAGAAPEKGINAITLASRAIASLDLGRIDHETTCNIGTIEGGMATNIVPALVTVKGEVRSHDPAKLEEVTNRIVGAFEGAVNQAKGALPGEDLPRLETTVSRDFSHTFIPDDHPMIELARTAASHLGRSIVTKTSGGGADANVFFEHGIMTGVLGTGMRDMHSVRESVRLADMVRSGELLLEIIRLHAEG